MLARLSDVRELCEKRRASLNRLLDKPARPVQAVRPEPVTGAATAPRLEARRNALLDDIVVVAADEEATKKIRAPSIKFKVSQAAR